jgi:dTDP-4-amino-4,6-dideoxygalactose transaminase
MFKVPFTDLRALHEPIASELRAAASRVIASGRFILGQEVAAFERELASALRSEHAVGVSSGTDALLALLMAAGVGPGDEVVTTPFSFFASTEAIVRLGATPVFADVEPDTWNLDGRAAAARIGARTRAVVVVHLFGRPAALGDIEAAAAAVGAPVIVDAAQAIGAGGPLGFGAAVSFFPSKNLGGFGDGGAVLTRDPAVAHSIRALRNHGASDKLTHARVGGNFRLDEMQAALLRIKLPLLDAWTARRRAIAAAYTARLATAPIGLPPPEPRCVWNQYVVRVPDGRRSALRARLAERGIETAVYYPTPIHLQPALKSLGYGPGSFPNAERAAAEALALPIFPSLEPDAVAYVADAIADFFR